MALGVVVLIYFSITDRSRIAAARNVFVEAPEPDAQPPRDRDRPGRSRSRHPGPPARGARSRPRARTDEIEGPRGHMVSADERTAGLSLVDDTPRRRQARSRHGRRSARARPSWIASQPPGAGLPAGRAASGGRGPNRRRVAIIGAGAGGVAAAYFLADSHDVDLFEARSKIGGHCDTHVIDYRGHRLAVDLGAQFFHPDTHPLYVTLLEQLGLYDPARPDTDDTLAAPASLCIFPTAGGPPTFSSSHPLSTPHRAIEFLTYLPLARHAVSRPVVGDDGRPTGSAPYPSASRSRIRSCTRGPRR